MTRLLVDDGEVRRSFKVGEGVLVIGSGEGAALRLTSPDVAEEHAELDVRGKRVFLRARPGVLPPKVGGVLIEGEHELAPGARIEVGSASILVEFEGEPGVSPVAPVATTSPAIVKKRKPGGTASKRSSGKRASGKRASSGARPKSGSVRKAAARRRSQRPPWVTPVMLLGVALAIGIFARFVAPAMFGDAAPEFAPLAHYHRANKALATGDYEEALAALDTVPAELELDPVMAGQMADLRAIIEQEIVTRDLRLYNALGDAFLTTQLKRFESEHLQGLPQRPAVRVFLVRAAEFEERWPEHGQLDWVHRMQKRYSSNISLTDPPSFEDVEFEVYLLNRADPRDFAEMFRALERFRASSGSADRALAAELVEQTTAERQAWFEDKLRAARAAYDDDDRGRAIEWLVRIVLYTGDAEMAAEGAGRLTRFNDLDEYLRGYRRSYPGKFERLAQHPLIMEYLVEHPLD